jgi:hypothetical protein
MKELITEPEWLESFQLEFAKSIRTPFDFSNGKSIRKQVELFSKNSYENIAPFKNLSPQNRLAIYNEQYWFRFLTLMQNDFPLLSRFMGLWEFNQFVTGYLNEKPSSSVFLQNLGEGFPKYISSLKGVELSLRGKYFEMATLDRIWTDVFMSGGAKAWKPSESELERLDSQLLNFHPSFKLYTENWNWVDLRKTSLSLEGEERLLVKPSKTTKSWVFFMGSKGVVSMPLEGALARLLELLQTELLHIALEKVAIEFPKLDLSVKVMHWFQQGLNLGWFVGLKK